MRPAVGRGSYEPYSGTSQHKARSTVPLGVAKSSSPTLRLAVERSLARKLAASNKLLLILDNPASANSVKLGAAARANRADLLTVICNGPFISTYALRMAGAFDAKPPRQRGQRRRTAGLVVVKGAGCQ